MVNEFGSFDILCIACPLGALCDGSIIEKCPPGFQLLEDDQQNSVCDPCRGNTVCNGTNDSSSCSSIKGAKHCEDGLVKSCDGGFKISEDKASCIANKAASSCEIGCMIGIAIAVVAVIGLVAAFVLMLYFKKQRNNIGDIVFRNIENLKEVRSVEGSMRGNRLSQVVGANRHSGIMGGRDDEV